MLSDPRLVPRSGQFTSVSEPTFLYIFHSENYGKITEACKLQLV
jgi:hypothetical protein